MGGQIRGQSRQGVDGVEAGPGVIGMVHRLYGPQAPWMCYSMLRRPAGTRLMMVEGSDGSMQRNMIVEGLPLDAEWLLLVEDDHLYPPDALERLLSHSVDIVAGLTPMRRPPFWPCAFEHLDGPWHRPITKEAIQSGELVECSAVGVGFTLVRREVFDVLKPPWFEPGQMRPGNIADDIHFCKKARASGFRVFVDAGLRIVHLTMGMLKYDNSGDVQFSPTANMADAYGKEEG